MDIQVGRYNPTNCVIWKVQEKPWENTGPMACIETPMIEEDMHAGWAARSMPWLPTFSSVNRRLCFPFKLSLNFSQATGQEELGLLKDWTAPLFCRPASSRKHLSSRKAEEEANGWVERKERKATITWEEWLPWTPPANLTSFHFLL